MDIKIKDEIVEEIKKKIEGTGFESVEEYVNYVLDDLVSENELSEEDEEKVKERLRALGYMD